MRPTRGLAATRSYWRGWLGQGSPGRPSLARVRSSARRWPSRASPTCRPGRRWLRSRPRCPRRRAASATGTTASPGCATRRSPCRRSHYLNLDWEADEFMQFVADLEPNEDGALQIMYGIDGRRDLTESTLRRALRLRRRAAPCGSATARSTSARTTSSARCSTRSCCTPAASQRLPRRLWPIVDAQASCATQVWTNPGPGNLGGPGSAPALRLVEADVLGRARSRRQAGRDPRRRRSSPRRWRATAEEIKADILEHGVRGGVLRQHYEHRCARRVHPPGCALRLPARATTSGCGSPSTRSPPT